MFGKKRKQQKELQAKAELQGRIDGLVAEKHFWVEQGRNLQNSVQMMHRLYADLLQHAARGVTDDELRSHISEVREHLLKPVIGVEAIAALTSTLLNDTQGAYTPVGKGVSLIQGDLLVSETKEVGREL